MKFTPVLDKNFKPIYVEFKNFTDEAKRSDNHTLEICVERNDGYNYLFSFPVFSAPEKLDKNLKMADRIIKSILWVVGGYKIYLRGDRAVYENIKAAYSIGGSREFDKKFMERVYESPFEVIWAEKDFPKEKKCNLSVGGHLDGCRIGFDAGGSDRKVSAVIDGKVVYSEEVVWFPKINTDPEYHRKEIMAAMRQAASKMPRVDAIGVSSAGVYVNNKIMVASLFLKVNDEDFEKKVKTMYIDIAKEMGAPLEVANDGDVTALAGAIDLNDNEVLGIAMGTSEAVGYINSDGGLNGWLSELAFVPVDYNDSAMVDEWSGDYGCGVKYFSQDGVIKLAELGGFKFDEGLSPAEKLKVIQKLMIESSPLAKQIYEDIGVYLGYTLAYYSVFYDIKHVLLLGRVTSGEGGNIIMDKAKEVVKAEFPNLKFEIEMPDENNRRVGQSIAAASLAASKK